MAGKKMPGDFSRIDRVQDTMQKVLASILQLDIKDPRVSMVTITEVVVSKDLKYAKVYVTVLEDDKAAECIKVLNKAAGFIRVQLSKKMQLRSIPSLKFIFDDTTIRANRISQIIDDAILGDNQRRSNDNDSRTDNS